MVKFFITTILLYIGILGFSQTNRYTKYVPLNYTPSTVDPTLLAYAIQAKRARMDKEEELRILEAQKCIYQVKEFYNNLKSYPQTIKNGWHNVISLDNDDFCEERQVLIENERVIVYLIPDQPTRKIISSHIIKNGLTTIFLSNPEGSPTMLDLYFLEDCAK